MSEDVQQVKGNKQNSKNENLVEPMLLSRSIHFIKPTMQSSISRREDASRAHFLYVLSKITPDILVSLTQRQIEGFRLALAEKHPVDYRFSLPLWFIKMYIVVSIGRDRRSSTVLKEKHRRVFSYLCGVLGGIYALLCMLAPLIFILLYLAKSWLDIDYFESFHLSVLFEDW
jgi:hypothetical protein